MQIEKRRITFERTEEHVTITIWSGEVLLASIIMDYREFDALRMYADMYRKTNAVSSTFVITGEE